MATLTYNPSEQAEGELTAEEQDSLEVGEKLAEQQGELLAGKFKDAEELEKGYIELQKKLGDPKEEAAEPEAKKEEEEEDTKIDTSFLNTLWEEAQGDFKQETLDKLANMEAKDIAQMYLQEKAEAPEPTQAEFTEQNVKDLKGVAGGEEQYQQMMQWAGDNLQKGEIEMFDAIMDRGDPLAAFFAVQSLAYRFSDVQGKDGQMLTGKAAKADTNVFKSQAQVVEAMKDSRYDKDPAYRQELYDKLERSNLQF